jgi:DNA polymerase III subunit epsilon
MALGPSMGVGVTQRTGELAMGGAGMTGWWPFPSWRQEKHPLLQRNADYFARFDFHLPIASGEFVVFDTELTGLNAWSDEIISIGAVRIRNLNIIFDECFYSPVRPNRAVYSRSTLVHRITPEQMKNAPALDTVLPSFVEFCGGAFLVGHCVSLDLPFLKKATRRIMGGVMRNPCLDSLLLARLHREELSRARDDRFLNCPYNLAVLARAYGLPTFSQHHSLEDALQTAYLFVFLVRSLQEHGYTTLKDLYRAARPRLGWI